MSGLIYVLYCSLHAQSLLNMNTHATWDMEVHCRITINTGSWRMQQYSKPSISQTGTTRRGFYDLHSNLIYLLHFTTDLQRIITCSSWAWTPSCRMFDILKYTKVAPSTKTAWLYPILVVKIAVEIDMKIIATAPVNVVVKCGRCWATKKCSILAAGQHYKNVSATINPALQCTKYCCT